MLEKMLGYDNNDTILNLIYDYQEQNCIVDEKTKNSLKILYNSQEKELNNIKNKLENVIPDKEEVKEIIDLITNYKEELRKETSFLNERYYKVGLKAGVTLIIECMK